MRLLPRFGRYAVQKGCPDAFEINTQEQMELVSKNKMDYILYENKAEMLMLACLCYPERRTCKYHNEEED